MNYLMGMIAPLRPVWLTVGILAVGLAVTGIFLPLLPTTPFLLVAAFAFARSSPRLHGWLVNHRRFGPAIENWRRHGAISRRAKTAAVGAMTAAVAISWISGLPGSAPLSSQFRWRSWDAFRCSSSPARTFRTFERAGR